MKLQHQLLLRDATSKRALLYVTLYVATMVVLAFVAVTYVDQAWLRGVVADRGSTGLMLFGLIQYLYIILVPVYNTAIHLTAGYIFGGHVGWALNFITTTAGLFTIVWLVKRHGRPLLERVVAKSFLDRYDRIAGTIGPLTLFAMYVLPLFPDDEMTYLAAAANVKLGRYILPILLGNVTKAAVSYIGDTGGSGFIPAVSSRLVVGIIGLILISAQEYFVHRRRLHPYGITPHD